MHVVMATFLQSLLFYSFVEFRIAFWRLGKAAGEGAGLDCLREGATAHRACAAGSFFRSGLYRATPRDPGRPTGLPRRRYPVNLRSEHSKRHILLGF